MKTGKRSSKTDVYSEFASAFLPVTISVIVGQTKIGLLLETLYRICLEEDFCKEERLQAELTSLIFTLYDLLINENTHYKSLSDKSMASIQYRYEIDTLLAQNCTKDIDLAFLSREPYLSPKRVAVLIKSLYGKPFRHVRTEMRIQFAKQLLKESDLTIAQIGKKIGYGSTRGFLNAFFVFAGCTPSDYRKKKYQQEKSSL